MKRFLFIVGVLLLGLVMRAQSVSYLCRYWFDQDEGQITFAVTNNNLLQMELDVEALSPGIHLLYVQVKDSTDNWCSPEHYMFYKTIMENPINTNNLVYHCWFDEDVEHMQSGSFGTGLFLLNAAELEEGTHLLYVVLENDGLLTTAENYLFHKVAGENPINPDEVGYRCWFDQDDSTIQTGVVGNGVFQLDTESLSSGIHTLYIQLDNGTSTAPQCYLFYKKPEKDRVARWEYWLNDAINQRHTTNLSPYVDTLNIISLLPVETCPIRSTCFHFHPNGGEPYINAKNEVTFRFWDTECHFIDTSALFVDEHVSVPILADSLIRDTTVCIPAPRDNQMQWYKVPLVVGDSIAFKTDKACTVQLFAPSGEEVYAATASEALVFGGIHAWEDGDYYLVVHDVTGSGDEICLTNVYVHKYAILAYDVHLVGNGGCSTITFQGNGFNSLLDAYLVNYQNDTIHRLDIGHESNTTTTVTFDFYQVNLGVYDVVFQFYGETVRVNGALEVQEPVDILLTSTVSYPSRFLRNTPCTYTFTITNTGNMTAYAVPIYLYISTPTENGISKLEFDGLNLPTLLDYFDLDSLSQNEVEELRQLSDEIQEDHYFFMYPSIDEDTGDSIVIRSNHFFLNLAPFETKTLSLRITSDELLEVWMTVPNDTIWPITSNRYSVNQFCCAKEIRACRIGAVCTMFDWADLIGSAFPGTPFATITSISSCACDLVSLLNTIATGVLCNGHLSEGFWRKVHEINTNSIVGAVTSCFKKFIPGARAQELAQLIGQLKTAIGASVIDTTIDCWDAAEAAKKKSPGCPDGGPDGGPSTPVNSLDPNDIRGYLSESGSHYMRQEIQNVQYEIEFENDTTLATAAAHTIIVRDTLDAAKFDLNSLAARSVTIGDKRLDLNGEQTFARTLDLRPELYVIAQVEQDYDPTTGIIQWTIQSLDPMTMEPTNDPNQGVLPVNYYGNGVGFIDYSIDIKEPFADGTSISNRAGIIFDQNEVIMTPTWTNIIDAVKPTSYIDEVTFEADTLNFSFVSSDNRSGVWYHTLYYRNDSTEMEWKVKVPKIVENSYMLPFKEYQTTEYLVMAVDSAGNHEEKDMVAEYVYYYEGIEPICQTKVFAQGWNWFSTYLDITMDDLKAALAADTPNSTITIKSSNGNTLYSPRNHAWNGQLTTLDVAMMYYINVAEACEITLEGTPINPAEHPITILGHGSTTWIGFPFAESMTLTEAFAQIVLNGDKVKSSNGNATYTRGNWNGNFSTLEPGKGYLYVSPANAPDRTFTFPTGAK